MVKRDERLVSLDVFRGLTIALMILVNNPGSWAHIYAPLEHSAWNGWTPTDLVFPFFLFIVGVAMTFSFSKMGEREMSKAEIYKKVITRTILLFVVSWCMGIFPLVRFEPLRLYDFSSMRIMGVLQRIALCYLFASVIYLQSKKVRTIAFWGLGLIIFYWIIMMTIPVPGYGAGVLTKEGNLATYIDKMLMPGHLWKPGWDPEGLLSTIPAIGTVIIGILTGKLLRSNYSKNEKAVYMFFFGNILLVAGMITNAWFPINKGLWTSSYVLFTGGFAMEVLAMCYWLIDIKGYQKWAKPFVVYGMNAIAVFVLSGLLARLMYMIPLPDQLGGTIKGLLYQGLLGMGLAPINASLVFAVGYVLFWLGIMWVFYNRKIFIKI